MNGTPIYGVFLTPEEEKERATWHDTTYLEVSIPEALEEELSDYISKRVDEFEKKCNCGLCKIHAK